MNGLWVRSERGRYCIARRPWIPHEPPITAASIFHIVYDLLLHGIQLRSQVPAERCDPGHRPDNLYSAEGNRGAAVNFRPWVLFGRGARLKAAFQIPIASPIASIVSYRSGLGWRLGATDRQIHSTSAPVSSPPAQDLSLLEFPDSIVQSPVGLQSESRP